MRQDSPLTVCRFSLLTLSLLLLCLSNDLFADQGMLTEEEAQAFPEDQAAVAAAAEESSVLTFFRKFVLNGGHVAAGVGLRNKGSGTISIGGIPAGSTIEAAYLYWTILNSTELGSFRTVQLNEATIKGTLIGSDRDPCWNVSRSWVYRAEVTSHVAGNGNYSVADVDSGLTNGSDPWSPTRVPPFAEGASLVVIYRNSSSPRQTVVLHDGAKEFRDNVVAVMLENFVAANPVASASFTLLGADGQTGNGAGTTHCTGELTMFNGSQISGPPVGLSDWDGADGGAVTQLWDTHTHNVTSLVSPGSTSAIATTSGVVPNPNCGLGDCLVWVAAVLQLSAVESQASRELIAGMGSDPSAPGTESVFVTQPVTEARFPLGSTFFIQLVVRDQSGNRVPVRSQFDLEQAAISPAIPEEAIFPEQVAIEYDSAIDSDMKFFHAAHLGSVILNIMPLDDPTIPPVRVQITINRPLRLGSQNTEVDTRVIDFGHLRGIPVDMLKGQVRRESDFRPEGYRYEVLSHDLGRVSGGETFRTQLPYSQYILPTTDGLPQGAFLVRPDDVHPRAKYKILVNNQEIPIPDIADFVSALEIYERNDSRNATENWSTANPKPARRVRRDPTLLDFTAQTTIAASYGLLQITYITAVRAQGWTGINGSQNPRFLFDLPANIAAGSDSLTQGTGYLQSRFPRANPKLSRTDPKLKNRADLEEKFRKAFNVYNRDSVKGPYGGEVLGFSRSYAPVASTTIFPQ